jgi:hypothetical protein
MSMSVVDAEVRRYVEAVRAHLADLAPDDRAELLEDLEAHLLEVAAEDDGTLELRLGPPDAYAEELRVSAGIEPHSEAAVGFVGRIRQSEISSSIRAITESAQGRAVREFLRQIAPGWWVARGYLLVLLAALLYGRSAGTPVRENFPIPFLPASSYPIAIVLIPAAVWASWMLGRRGRQHRAWRVVSVAATLVVVGAALTIADDIRTTGSYGYVGDESYQEPQTYLHHADGSAIANICPYSSDGTLLSGVLLFDQGGRAINNTADTASGYGIQRQRPAILNAYPLTISAHDESGQPTPVLCPPSVSAQPTPSAPVTPAPIPTAGD